MLRREVEPSSFWTELRRALLYAALAIAAATLAAEAAALWVMGG